MNTLMIVVFVGIGLSLIVAYTIRLLCNISEKDTRKGAFKRWLRDVVDAFFGLG